MRWSRQAQVIKLHSRKCKLLLDCYGVEVGFALTVRHGLLAQVQALHHFPR